MSRSCDICGKGVMSGNKVSKSYNHTRRTWRPNLLKVRTVIDGRTLKLNICTRCLKSEYIEKKVKIPTVAVESK